MAAQSGCLACHKIGENGNDGPGPHLTNIGSKLAKAAIRRTLENPTAPMPSFANLPPDKKTALVNFLASLKGNGQRGARRSGAAAEGGWAPGRPAGTLPAESVRAMFDRIAGVYDLMNTVMTAGLHHRWRARAVDLARVGPGDRALDVATGTGDLAIELAARGATWSARTSRRGCSAAPGAKAPDVRFERADALALPYADDEFAAATVGFGARNFGDLDAGPARDGPGRAAGRPGRDPGDHDADQAAAVGLLLACGSIASCRCSAASTRRTRICRTR